MDIACPGCLLRPLVPADAESLARHANDHGVWLNLRDRFPHPYGVADAEAYIAHVASRPVQTSFGIVVGDEAIGSISLMLGDDIHAGWASLDDQVSSQNTCDEGQRKQTPNDIAARQIWDHHTPAYIRPGLRIPAGSKEALMPRVRVITASGCGSNTSMLERTSTGARTNIA